MASLNNRLNPLFTIKECSSYGSLYNKGYCCTPDSSQQPLRDCPKCGNPVEGPNCQGCALWRKELKDVWLTICHENGIYQDFLHTYEPSDDDTNVVNAPREPFVVKQDPDRINKEESFKKKDMSIEEIMSEKRLIDDEINDITNDLSYKRFRGEKIDDEYERDCEIKIKQLLQDYSGLDIEMRKKERIDPHSFNAESNLIELLLNRDILIDSSPKGRICLVENLLYDNSSPRPPEELNLEIADTILESLSPSPIPVTDSDSFMEEINLFLASDDLMPPGIENDDYDSERDIHFLEELFNNDSLPLPEFESFHFDPSFPRPPPEPPDDEIS
ncbi:hypothetical protein Tco_1154616 [Tanacetum coccineum]